MTEPCDGKGRTAPILAADNETRPQETGLCGAKTRAGGACLMRPVAGKRRCRLHGGLSTGPKTAQGRARIAAAQRKRLEANTAHKVRRGAQKAKA